MLNSNDDDLQNLKQKHKMTNKNLLYTSFQEIKKSTCGKTQYQYIEKSMTSQECKCMKQI